MVDGHGGGHGGGHGHGHGGHGAGVDHSGMGEHGAGAFGHSAGVFGHSFDLGHMAASIGHQGSGHSGGHHGHGHVGHAPGAAHGHHGWAFGYMSHALASIGVLDAAAASRPNQGQEVRLPGIMARGDTIQLLVWPHGKTNTQHMLRRIAARHGLLTLSRKTRSTVASCKENAGTLLDTKQFDGPGHNSRPSASFNGATGSTTVWNEFWMAPSKKHWWQSPGLHLGPPLRCHLIITGYTWFFEQTGDFETRIAVTVTNPMTTRAGEWVPFDEEAVRRHALLAKKIVEDLYLELSQVAPAEYSKTMRQLQARGAASQMELAATAAETCTPAAPEFGPGIGRIPRSVQANAEALISFEMQSR